MKVSGARVVDAAEPLTVLVSRTDISKGAKQDADACAAAVAICRQTGCDEAKVHLSRVYVRNGDSWVRYATPDALRSEIIAFDRGGEFQPGEYVLKPLQPILRFGNQKRADWIKKNANRKPRARHPQKGARVTPHVVKGIRGRMSAD